jgi:hypothetical protein
MNQLVLLQQQFEPMGNDKVAVEDSEADSNNNNQIYIGNKEHIGGGTNSNNKQWSKTKSSGSA